MQEFFSKLDRRQVLAWAFIVAGVVVGLIGWIGVSGRDIEALQLPYLASGAVGALVLTAIGAALLISSDVRADRERAGRLEAEVMEVLWASGEPMPVRRVLDALNADRTAPLAYTTVMTVLARLAEKGVLERQPAGRGFVYKPAVGDEAGIAVRGVVRDYGEAALAHFVEQAKADPKLYRRLQRLMGEGRA